MGVMQMPLNGDDSMSRLTQLKKVATRLRMEIPKLTEEEKKTAIETYSILLKEVRRLEKIEQPVYLLRYE